MFSVMNPMALWQSSLGSCYSSVGILQYFFLSGADLYSMYVGEGESLLRDTFRQARLAAPSIIFFDEADAVASRRFYTVPVAFTCLFVCLFEVEYHDY